MQFNASTNSIIADITFWTQADTTRYATDPDRTRNCNLGLDTMAAIVMEADGKWKWDDTNHTDQPIGTTNIVANQQDYGISGATFLRISKVQYLNSSSNWQTLDPVDEHDPDAQNLIEKRNTGTPLRYLKRGNSVYLDPIPTSAKTNGLRIFFQRNVSYFVVGDTTKEPGFAQPFHRLVPLYASRDYLAVFGPANRYAAVEREIAKYEARMTAFYASREDDKKVRLKLVDRDYGANRLGGKKRLPSNVVF